MDEERQDIFGGSLGEPKKPIKKKGDLSFEEGISNILEGFWHLFSGFRHIFFKRMPMNLLILIILLVAVSWGTYYLKPQTKNVVMYNVTQNTTCPECAVCEACPDINETECPECEVCEEAECVAEHWYHCSDGRVVGDADECEVSAGMPSHCEKLLHSDYIETKNGVSIIIGNVEHKEYPNGIGYVQKVEYSIVNNGSVDIKPRIEFKVYEEWNADIASGKANYTINFEDYLSSGDCITDVKEFDVDTTLKYEAYEQTLRLELLDASTDPDSKITAVTRKFLG